MSNHKSPGISNTLLYSLLFVVGVILTVILLFLEFPTWMIYVIILGLTLSILTIRPMYLIYKSKSLPAIDRYVIANQKKPLFGYAYALAYGDHSDIEASLKRILQKYNQAEMQTTYGANLALHRRDLDAILEQAEKMTKADFKEYYFGAAYLLKGDTERTQRYLTELTTPWMIHSLKASIALHRNDKEAFRIEADQSSNSATGLQKYTLHHMFKRMEAEAFQQ